MRQMWDHVEVAQLFNGYLDGDQVDWRTAMRGWSASVDWPGCWAWEELTAAWPEALVLLSVRDPEAWYSSVRATVHEWSNPSRDVGPPAIRRLLDRLWEREFGGWEAVFDRGHTIDAFLAHNQSVRERCPSERLLEWKVDDGWPSLCRALQVPRPAADFPHLNARYIDV